MTRSIQSVGLAFPRGGRHDAYIEGIYRYAHEHGRSWSYVEAPESLCLSVANLVNWDGAGVIAALNNAQEAKIAANFHLPIVNCSCVLRKSPVPRSVVDNHAIGVLAAEHLHGRGFHNYAFYGTHDVEYSRRRQKGFRETLATVGFGAAVLTQDSTLKFDGREWLNQQKYLTKWLATLKTPCGVFAVSDARARQLIESCGKLGLNVPDQIAVVGVDEQQVMYEHVRPTITSIARDYIQEGYHAASLLDKAMRGHRVSREDRLTRPLKVIARESTETFAVSDERLRNAMNYVRNRIEDAITIRDLCDQVGVSRRWLEYSFRENLGETPYQYIQRQRVGQARRMLTVDPSAKLHTIAQRVGFSSAKQLAKVFRREFGSSPRHFRKSVVSK